MSPSTVFSDTFTRAVEELHAARPRKEITLSDLPAPQRLAPFAYALGATVAGEVTSEEAVEGRLILLYDPAGQDLWRGTMRLVTYVTGELEPELATDPLLPSVAWSWLSEALTAHAAAYTALAGTVTQTASTRFGQLAGPPTAADLEIRASWTPTGPDLTTHALAWCALLASTAGLPPPGVSALPGRRMGVA